MTTPAEETFRWEGPTCRETLGQVRVAVEDWGRRTRLPANLPSAVAQATVESMARAADRAERLTVSISHDDDTVTSTVSVPPAGQRGTVRLTWPLPRVPEPEAEDPEDRLHGMEAITDPALARLDMAEMSQEMLVRVRDVLGVDAATVMQYDPASEQLVATAASGIEEEVRQGVHVQFGLGFVGTVAATQKPLVIEHVDETTVLSPLLRESGLHTLLGVPMLAGGRLMGVLHVGSREPRSFAEHEISLLQLAADRIALAAQAEISHTERAAATALQRSLLPARLPAVPGFDIAARYVPSATFGVGGDWYDVFPLPGNRIGIVIGDVSGHGLASAVVMGRLRSALRAYALDNESPSAVLDKLDRKAKHFEAGTMTTVAYGVIDLATNQLRLSLAGHLPPVLALPGQPAELVDLAPDPPIGFDLRLRPRHCASVDLPPGASVCFYTDGLIERRDLPIDDGLALLRTVVRADRAELTCARLMARFVGTRSLADDVAVLVAHRAHTGE